MARLSDNGANASSPTRGRLDACPVRTPDPVEDSVFSPRPDVHSRLEVVRIADVEASRSEIAARCFCQAELAELATRRTQTMAGFLAAKRALVGLFSSLWETDQLSEIDFVLSHDERGAPRLVVVGSDLSSDERAPILRAELSISHTRETAYGLVAYQEPPSV